MISERISDDILPKMKILNMVITILINALLQFPLWSVVSGIEPRVIKRNVT